MTQALLYVVATPVGNLADITLRALEILKSVDAIAAEDTRHTAGLLRHYGISKPLLAVHEHNERQSTQQLIAKLQAGESVALVTDAGTPGISDPGAIVVAEVRAAGFKVVPLPGPSAVIAALSVSGIVEAGFTFIGFLPAAAGARKKALQALVAHPYTLAFYEAPHRILASVKDMGEIMGAERPLTIARELTKTFETIHRATLAEMLTWLENDANQQRGEFVLLLEAAQNKASGEVSEEVEHILKTLLAELPLKQAVQLATEITGLKKNTLYDFALQLKNEH
jgi:16S rRNA (cytidine1402-2'-O)-methyltransferase